MVEYVMTPESFSLYRKGGREVALFGDSHDITAGAGGGNPAGRIRITDYLKRRLAENPNLHVYGEIAPPERGQEDLFPTSSNKELQRLRRLKNDRTFPHRNRIHNVDTRNTVVPLAEWEQPGIESTYDSVKSHLGQKARELLKPGTAFKKAEQEMDDFLEDAVGGNPGGYTPREWARYLDEEEYNVKTMLMRPVVEAEIIDTVRRNPHNANSMIFYVGDGHKQEAERHFLDKKWNTIHKASADEDSGPMAMGPLADIPMPQFENLPKLFPEAKYMDDDM